VACDYLTLNIIMIKYSEYFKLWESSSNTIDIPYIIGDQYTAGRHSFGDEAETPAKDPAKFITPTIVYNADCLKQLLDKYGVDIINVVYKRYEWGSYHERQLYCQAHLQISEPADIDDYHGMIDELENCKIEDDYYFPLDNHRARSTGYDIQTTQFTNFDDILKNWQDMVKDSEIKIQTGSSEDFWKRKILAAQVSMKKDYDGD